MKNPFTCITLLALLLAGLNSKAQKLPLHIGIGVDLGLPTGAQADAYSITAGLSANASFSILPQLDLTGSLGYQRWIGKNITTYDLDENFNLVEVEGDRAPAASYVPLLLGAKYDLGLKVIPLFAKLELGPVFNTQSEAEVSSVGLGMSPGFGVTLGKLEALLKYEGWRNNGYTATFLGAKVIYRLF